MSLIIQHLNKYRELEWGLGFISSINESLNGNRNIKWVKPLKDRWFADPFIFKVEGNVATLFVEEFEYELHKGRIAEANINLDTLEVIDFSIILEEPYHLSFPFILRRGNDVYVMPESSKSGATYIYRYADKHLIDKKMVIDRPLADACVAKFDDRWMLLSTEEPEANENHLLVFEFDIETLEAGNLVQQIDFKNKTARNAGAPFVHGGMTLRPAQDCDKTYGGATVIQKLTTSDGKLIFDEIARIAPSAPYPFGCHTLNSHGGLVVIDGKRYHYAIGHFVDNLAKIKQKIMG